MKTHFLSVSEGVKGVVTTCVCLGEIRNVLFYYDKRRIKVFLIPLFSRRTVTARLVQAQLSLRCWKRGFSLQRLRASVSLLRREVGRMSALQGPSLATVRASVCFLPTVDCAITRLSASLPQLPGLLPFSGARAALAGTVTPSVHAFLPPAVTGRHSPDTRTWIRAHRKHVLQGRRGGLSWPRT